MLEVHRKGQRLVKNPETGHRTGLRFRGKACGPEVHRKGLRFIGGSRATRSKYRMTIVGVSERVRRHGAPRESGAIRGEP